jgi:hypothetical protein
MASTTQAVSSAPRAERTGIRAPRVDVLGIGAQKAGTTWLHRMLGAHPDIFMAHADDKDLRFFSAFYDRGYEWYERHFTADGGASRRGEFSTSYFYCKDAPERVHRYNPNMRLLLSLRDPVKRLISHHKHEIRMGRLTTDLSLQRGIENNPSYVEQSMYFTQLSRWLEYFPMSSIHIVIFEELFLDPSQAVRGLYDFVGVSSSLEPEALHDKVNEGRIPRSRFLDRGVRLSTSALRAVGAGWMIESLKKAGFDKRVKRVNTRSDEDIEIDEPLIERLRAEFAAENAKLFRLIGRDLSIWAGCPEHPSARAGGNT